MMNILKSNAVKLMGILLLGVTLSAHGVSDKQRAAIEERIAPAGSVCMEGDSGCGAAMASSGGGTQSPEDIYNASCMACHATGAAGAPKMGESQPGQVVWIKVLSKSMPMPLAVLTACQPKVCV